MRVYVLGELRIRDDAGGEVAVRDGKTDDLLRLLVALRGSPASVSTIAVVLWGDDPPRSAIANIQTYMSQVRKVLHQATRDGGRLLVHGSGGYRLSLPPDASDVAEFVRLVAQGRTLRDRAPAARRDSADVLWTAASLWHGGPMTIRMRQTSLFADGLARRFEEIRLGLYADLVDVLCDTGNPSMVMGDLRELIAEYPHRETVHALLLRALYASGDTASALWAYHRLRSVLADELGVEPSEWMRRLYESILRETSVASV
jgi:DNA-binding SARP family transcriptional activator